jgi:hypothetical protein
MDRRLIPVATLVVGLAAGGLLALWLRGEPAVEPVVEPAPGSKLAVPLEEPPANPEGLPKYPPEGMLPPEAETHPRYFQDLEGEAPEPTPESLPAEVEYQRLDKLVAESEIPHRTIGAWDEAPESTVPGSRRAFVMVVDPSLSDADLEALARDLRAQHGDARILNVRIFDSEQGARRARWVDGGALAHEHLVAEVNINQALHLDAIRIRGRRVDP